jgi:hypothetical protein
MANSVYSGKTGEWYYPLDNSAVFMAATTSTAKPYVYRLSCELDRPVHLPDIEQALAKVIDRFPSFKTELRPGVFWYYLEPLKKPFTVLSDSIYPCEYHRLRRMNRYLFRVRVYGTRISCEFHHALTDGTGAAEFLKSLVAEYLTIQGIVCAQWDGIRRANTQPDPAELEDAYAKFSRRNAPSPETLPRASMLPGKRYSGPEYRTITGTVSVDAIRKLAHEKGASITELLASFHLLAIQSVLETGSEKKFGPVCLQIPVNIRKFYASDTVRNFFLFVPVSIDRRLGHYEFREILERVQCQLKLSLTRKELDRQIWRNVRGESLIMPRLVPLCIKNCVLRTIARVKADTPFSGSLSNLQRITMPEPFAAHIRRFDLVPSRNRSVGATIAVISWKDVLSITVGSLVQDRSFERFFFRALSDTGIPVLVTSNM